MSFRAARDSRRKRVLALALFGTVACQRASPSASRADTRPSAPPPAVLAIEAPAYDFGVVLQSDAVSHEFELSNAGATHLDLASTTEALGCTGQIEPHSLDPGAAARLKVTCLTEYYGPLHVTLAVRTAATGESVGQVELTASVTPLLAFDTQLLELHMPFGEERSADVHLQGALDGQAKLTLEDAGDVGFTVTPLPATHGVPAGLRLRVKGRKVGVHAGNVVLATNLARPREISLPYSCQVTGSLAVTPSTPYFDLKAPGGRSREVAVTSSQPGFVVRGVRVEEGPFSASFARDTTGGGYTVTVALRTNGIAGDARGTVGRLLILSNDRAEPEKELPLFAFGGKNGGENGG
jgi:uncharacterized protein DUF1573